MTLSRTYPTTQAVLYGGGEITPVGAGNLLDPVRTADDDSYDKCFVRAPYTSAPLSVSFNYDSLIPPASTVTAIAYTARYAHDFAAGLGATYVATNIGFGITPFPAPANVVVGGVPKAEDWVENTVTFDDNVFPMTVPDLVDLLGFGFPQSVGPIVFSPTEQTGFLDFFSTEIFFTLAAPGFGSAPGVFKVQRNSFSAKGVVTLPAGSVNAEYPLQVWFEFTNMDPEDRNFEDLGLGQGKLVVFGEQEISHVGDNDRNVAFFGATGRVLTPGTNYWVRVVAQTADVADAPVSSAWTAVTTPNFDAPMTF